MWDKLIDDINLEDINELIRNETSEKKTIEYKRDLKYRGDDKREFLADVSSFANTIGGYIIYGIREGNGIPVEIYGVELTNPDQDKLDIQNIIRDNLTPRITNLEISTNIKLDNGKYIVIIKIPQSYAAPHMIKSAVFNARNSNGKYPLDIIEIRDAFMLSDKAADRMRDFRVDRIGKIIADITPVKVSNSPKFIVHITPVSAFGKAILYDVVSLTKRWSDCRPIVVRGGWSSRPNFDGLLIYSPGNTQDIVPSYVQFFRNGCIEAVETQLFFPYLNKYPAIASHDLEANTNVAVKTYLSLLRELGIQPPFFVMLSFIGIEGHIMAVDPNKVHPRIQSIQEKNLLAPAVLFENYDDNPSQILKLAYDTFWNAAGWERDMNYNDKGLWTGWENYR